MSLTGARLHHYEIVGALGAGGMGDVYRAKDTKLGRTVALKVISPAMASHADRLDRFRREAKALAAIDHPNIVTVFSVEEADGIHFLTMQLVEGEPLDRVIPDGGMAADRIVAIGSGIAEALAAAHDKGIVHRDLKPANVMVSHDGRVKVLDFGLAKEISRSDPEDATLTSAGRTQGGVVLGTPAYMSPEQVAGRPVNHRTDIFSLGVLLYQMATGRRPFDGASAAELASAILRDTPPPISELRTDAPSGLAHLIRRCLEKDVARRVQTARDIGNELRDIAGASITPPAVESADAGFWVAVLPFTCRGAHADLDALADGLTEEILTGLSRFSYLRVIARSSTSRYADTAADIRTVGRELGARYVMEGSVRQAGSQLRVAARLVDAKTGAHLWAETYNRPFAGEAIFDVQDELVPRIVSSVADWYGALPHSMSDALGSKPVEQLSPYEAVLRSFRYTERRTADEHAAARAGLERAVQQAPGYADAWALLSIIYSEDYSSGFNLVPDPLGRALEAARRATNADSSSALAHFALARASFFRKEFPTCRTAAERAMALNPMDGGTSAFIGVLLAYSGDWEHGCALVERAMQLNPRHPGWYWFPLFLNAYRTHDYHRALSIALKINLPRFYYTHVMLGAVYGQLGEREPAAAALSELLALRPDFAASGRDDLGRWYEAVDLVDHLMDGLRKAGLRIPDAATTGATPRGRVTDGHASPGPSIAVLPFANMSADHDDDYFSDGLAEEIINLLARVSGLKVIARTSAFAFRGKEQDIRGIADALGVRTILQGSVRRAGTRVRVTVQLIDAADGSHRWSERYDRELTDVFAIQDDIGRAVSGALQVRLAPRAQAVNIEAYQCYLKGRHSLLRLTPDGIANAKEYFEQALSIDPDYAAANSGLAEHCHAQLILGLQPVADLAPRLRLAADRALALDPAQSEAHSILASVAASADYQWDVADGHHRKAVAAEGALSQARFRYAAWYLLPLGRVAEAAEQIRLGLETDPLSMSMHYGLTLGKFVARQHAEAIDCARKALEIDATFFPIWLTMGHAQLQLGSMADAITSLSRVVELAPWMHIGIGSLAAAYHASGDRERSAEWVRRLTADHARSYGTAIYDAVAGDEDAMFDALDGAWQQRDVFLLFVQAMPFFDRYRADARFQRLLAKMNLAGPS